MFLSFVLMPTYLHRPSLSLDWSSPRNVVPPFFSMCLSMSTCVVPQYAVRTTHPRPVRTVYYASKLPCVSGTYITQEAGTHSS